MLVILSGVAGAGKDTVKKELLKKVPNIVTIPSITSRNPRPGDIPGETYNFVSKEEFEQKIKNGEFYEYNLHHNNYYGTSKKILNEEIKNGKIIIKDIEVNGTENLVKILQKDMKVITIFLRVEKEELRNRLEQRIDKPSKEEIELRLSRFEYEESKIGKYDYMIKNNNLDKTVQVIMRIIEEESKINN